MFDEYTNENNKRQVKQPVSYTLILIILAAVIFSNAVTFAVVFIVTKNTFKGAQIVNPLDINVEYNLQDDYYMALANKALPSVVEVMTETEDFNGKKSYVRGSGVIVGKTTYETGGTKLTNCPLIITNKHVISSGISSQGNINSNATLMIKFAFRSTYLNLTRGNNGLVNVIALDPKLDIALLRLNFEVENIDDIIMEFADSNKLLYGQTVMSLGNALGNGLSVTQGIISLPEYTAPFSVTSGTIDSRVVQHSSPINQGNSGGALIDCNGKLIGVNTYSPSGTSDNVAYAIPSNTVRAILDNAVRNTPKEVIKPSETVKKNFKLELQSDSLNTAKLFLSSDIFSMTIVMRPQVADTLSNVYIEVDAIDVNSVFYEAGLQKGDRIISVGKAVYFDVNEKYIYHLAMGSPSILVMEEVLYYYGAEDKELGGLTIGYYRKSDGKTHTATIANIYLQEAIPFLK